MFCYSEDFASWKKAQDIYTRMLEFTFPEEGVIYWKWVGWEGIVIGRVTGLYNNLNWKEVLINGNGEKDENFSEELVLPILPLPPTSSSLQLGCTELHRVTQVTSLKNCLSTFNFFPVSFSPLLLYILRGNRTKLKKILNLNRTPK